MRLWTTFCLSCGRVLGEDDGKMVCREELERIEGIETSPFRCRHCDQRLPFATKEGLCYDCFSRFASGEVFLERSYALFAYEGLVKRLYQAFKFEERKGALEDLVSLAERKKTEWFSRLPEVDVVTVVPSHWITVWKRGFSPVEVFWRRFFSHLQGDILQSKWRRKKQKTLSREERMREIRGQFWVSKPQEIENMRVLVLDDVFTTGSTMEEVARVLREAGAFEVYGCVLGRDPFYPG
ncbi:MAG: ComF family protein [Brevinematales bacterium]|nr:ComF family protein [Brevinematales bacterium]